MTNEYVLATNDDGELAVRTVNATESSSVTSTNDIITRTEDGKLAVRVVGAGGGDQHNLGYYATQAALEEAYPTAEAGDWAIVGATDTVWIWDTDNSAWVDSDQKGQVTSVNGQTGAVTVSEVPSQTGYSGRVLGTDGFVAGWIVPEQVQRSTMPQASEDELGNIYQFTGTTDANYTNGYFYKCVSDGQEPATYSWTQTNVQPAPSGLPDQTGQSGKFLTTDGTDASWSNKPLVNNTTIANAIAIGNSSTGYYGSTVAVGYSAKASSNNAIAIGGNTNASGTNGSIAIGNNTTANAGIAIGQYTSTSAAGAIVIANCGSTYSPTSATAAGAIQLGSRRTNGQSATNSDANTFKVANYYGNYEIMSSDGTIPADRLTHAINKYSTMPTASADNLGWIVQFTGTTDATYTHGYIYECKAQGTTPDETYAWEAVEVQAGGGSSYTAGTGIDITNDTISVSPTSYSPSGYKVRQLVLYGDSELDVYSNSTAYSVSHGFQAGYGYINISSNTNAPSGGVVIGDKATSNGSTGQVLIGEQASSTAAFNIAIGSKASVTAQGAIQLGDGGTTKTNSDANTFKVGNANGNFELMDANGNLPADRLASTTGLADGNYRLRLVMASGVPTLEWVAE